MDLRQHSNEMKNDDAKPRYAAPQLRQYGDIHVLTQSAVGNMGDDGAQQGNSKTA